MAECDRASVFDAAAVERFAGLILEHTVPPSVLGERYHIERVLGRGGMATVYLAHDSRHGRKVAVKVLSPEVSALLTRERFVAEIKIAARLTHPHILGVHDSGETDGFLYYVMPYVDGESLRDLLHRRSQLPVEEALTIAREIADALHYAHHNGVIHRDIKPENILLESGHAVVADFGIARAIGAAAEGQSSGPVGFATGTPAYMSPEQATNGADVDRRTDIYSLACVLYEMLAGQPPFTGPSAASIVEQHLTMVPPPITTVRPDTPTSVVAAISEGLAKRAADRCEDAGLFGAMLLFPAASTSRPGSDAATVAPRSRRRLLLALAGVATIFATLTILALSSRSVRSGSSDIRTPVLDPRARDAYQNGVFFLDRRTATDRVRAIQELRRAVTIAPRFARAQARLAEAYAVAGYFGYPGGPSAAEAFDSAEIALREALTLDSMLPEAQLSRAKLRWMHTPNVSEAQSAVHKALALNPQLADAHFEHARIHAMRGDADSAIAAVVRMRELEATSASRKSDIAWVHWIVRRDSEAVVLAHEALALDSTSSTAYLALGGGLAGLGRYSEAIDAYERGRLLSGGNALFLPQLGYAYARTNQRKKAQAILRQLIAMQDAGRASPYYVAQVYLGLGQRDSALKWLQTAYNEHVGHVVFLRANPVWNGIRSDSIFRAIIRNIGLE